MKLSQICFVLFVAIGLLIGGVISNQRRLDRRIDELSDDASRRTTIQELVVDVHNQDIQLLTHRIEALERTIESEDLPISTNTGQTLLSSESIALLRSIRRTQDNEAKERARQKRYADAAVRGVTYWEPSAPLLPTVGERK